MVLFAIGAAHEFPLRCQMERYIVLEFDRTDYKNARRYQDRSALVFGTSINGRLDRNCVKSRAVSLGPKVADVVDAGTQISIISHMAFRPLGRSCRFARQAR